MTKGKEGEVGVPQEKSKGNRWIEVVIGAVLKGPAVHFRKPRSTALMEQWVGIVAGLNKAFRSILVVI
jgi:hypothetical protein